MRNIHQTEKLLSQIINDCSAFECGLFYEY